MVRPTPERAGGWQPVKRRTSLCVSPPGEVLGGLTLILEALKVSQQASDHLWEEMLSFMFSPPPDPLFGKYQSARLA